MELRFESWQPIGLSRRLYASTVLALMLFTAVAAVLMSAATAHADETDGGSGNGTSGGGPCVLYGWNIVDSIDEIVWQD